MYGKYCFIFLGNMYGKIGWMESIFKYVCIVYLRYREECEKVW